MNVFVCLWVCLYIHIHSLFTPSSHFLSDLRDLNEKMCFCLFSAIPAIVDAICMLNLDINLSKDKQANKQTS